MEKKDPTHIIHDYFKQLNKHAGKVKKGFTEKAIHDFRVDVKKLRAFLRMLRLRAKKPEQLKYSRPFKKMYSLTGEIRDRQLCLDRIKETDKTYKGSKLHDLKKEVKELAAKKDDFFTKKEFEEMEENIIAHLPVFIGSAGIKNFVQQKKNTINAIVLKRDFKDKELHSIRKSIKDIICITAISASDLRVRLPVSFWNDEKSTKAEDLSNTLGSFNDASTALFFLEPSEIKKTQPEEKKQLLSIRRQWLAEKRKLKKDILRQLSGIKL